MKPFKKHRKTPTPSPSNEYKERFKERDMIQVQYRTAYRKGELCAVAERGVVWTVHWRLSGEPGVKLAHVFIRLLQTMGHGGI